MNVSSFGLKRAVVLAVLAIGPLTLHAQTATPCIERYTAWLGTTVMMADRQHPEPAFTATVKHSFEQRLVDGNTIRWSTEVTQARDADGRRLEQHIQSCQIDSSGQPHVRVEYIIFDDKGKISTHWATGPGSAQSVSINHTRMMPQRPQVPFTPTIPRQHRETVREQLGTRTIAGIQATGTRVTETLPISESGSDMPIKVVRENWMSNDNPRTTLMISTDDPRTGKMTWEVTSLAVGPPDASLFAPPANYVVEDDSVTTEQTKP